VSAPLPLYNTAKWKHKRRYQLTAEPLCRMCAQLGKHTPATVADHIEPHRGDPEAFWANELQSRLRKRAGICGDVRWMARHSMRLIRGLERRAGHAGQSMCVLRRADEEICQ
jgi:hypothetical protein